MFNFGIRFQDRLINTAPLRRAIGFMWHLVGITLCWWLAFLLRLDFALPTPFENAPLETLWLAVVAQAACILIFRLYRGLWRFFTFRDCLITAVAFLVSNLWLAVGIYFWKGGTFEDFPRSVIVINYMLIIAWEIGGRAIVRFFREVRFERMYGKSELRPNVVLVGAPDECDIIIRSLVRQTGDYGRIRAIVTDARRHKGGRMHGIRVFCDLDAIGKIMLEKNAEILLIVPPFNSPKKVRRIVDSVSSYNIRCEYHVVPAIDDIALGRVDVSQIRRVEIEDLLNRKSYGIDVKRLEQFVSKRRLMVTGAGGSIGSEITRQLIGLAPKVLVLFEISEFALFEIERELNAMGSDVDIIAITGDVRKTSDIRTAIERAGGIDVVYHAAAYKHVDLMERNPFGCFENNVVGTAKLAEVSEEMGVEQFVLVSTDKAVRPTSLMGASKRLAEMFLIDRPKRGTQFRAVRFGNVLGSSGSVVPIFRKQIEEGGPVTVTSPDVTRFFMTIPEAAELVLVAGAVGEDRRILVLEMGDPVKIVDLARKMIELSGLVPDQDISIVFTGLKSGEKEFEELLTDHENVVRTEVDRIWVVKKGDDDSRERLDIGELLEVLDEGDPQALREFVHSMISGSRLVKD